MASGALRVLAVLCACSAAESAAGTITQVVGPDGDGVHSMDSPWGVAVDSAGNAYVAATGSNNIFQITPGGVVSQVMDASGDGLGHVLSQPTEVAVGPDDSVYAIASGSKNVFRKLPGGSWTQILDTTGAGGGPNLGSPTDIVIDDTGIVFVAGQFSNLVARIDTLGAVSVVLTATGDGAGNTLDEPSALATDSLGNLYVTGARSDNVFKVTPSGTITQILEAGSGYAIDYPNALDIAADGSVLIGCFSSRKVLRLAPGGGITTIGSSIDAMAVGERSDGLVFVAGANLHKIVGLRDDGPDCIALDSDGDGTNLFHTAARFAFAPGDRVYVPNPSHHGVFLLENSCMGPSVDLTGRWNRKLTGGTIPLGGTEPLPDRENLEDWLQSGADLTVADVGTGEILYTGTIDDNDRVVLSSVAQTCNGSWDCCSSTVASAEASSDDSDFSGSVGFQAIMLRGCAGWASKDASWSRCGNGILNVGEACDDGNRQRGDGCDDACQIQPCSNGVLDSGETCDDGNEAIGDGCDAGCDVERCYECTGEPSSCSGAVRNDCSADEKVGSVSLTIKKGDEPPSHRFRWRFGRGVATSLGDPTTSSEIEICMFDQSGAAPQPVFAATIAPGTDWQVRGGKLRYRSDISQPDGITSVSVSVADTTKATVGGKGQNLALPPMPVSLPLLLQLRSTGAGCLQTTYTPTGVVDNEETWLKLRSGP